MKLSIGLISQRLAAYITYEKYGDFPYVLHLHRPEHYLQQNILHSKHVYIAAASTLPPFLAGELESCLICIGTPPAAYFVQPFSIICVSESLDVFRLFNMLQKLYDQYDLWDQRLQECINSRLDLQYIVDVSAAIFQNPMYFCDSDYRILAGPRHDPQNIKYAYIPHRFIDHFKYDPLYQKMWQSDEPIICQGDSDDDRALGLIVRSHGQFAVYISLVEEKISLRNSDAALLQHMAGYVLMHYEQDVLDDENTSISLEHYFKQYLNQKPVSGQAFEKALALLTWKPDHTYYVCCIELSELDLRYNIIKYQCDQIEKIFTAAIVFAYNKNIIAIINHSLLDVPHTPEITFCSFLQNSNLKAGKSREFKNINNVRNYYIQALSALEIGKTTTSGLPYYKFETYCLQYMLTNSYHDLIPESLYPDGFMQMREYDHLHHTQYVLTLKTYFEQKFNTSRAANKLYIHRTTFLDRLDKIQNYFGINLADWHTCLYFMMVLESMGKDTF